MQNKICDCSVITYKYGQIHCFELKIKSKIGKLGYFPN